jgi:hypothetical protein
MKKEISDQSPGSLYKGQRVCWHHQKTADGFIKAFALCQYQHHFEDQHDQKYDHIDQDDLNQPVISLAEGVF